MLLPLCFFIIFAPMNCITQLALRNLRNTDKQLHINMNSNPFLIHGYQGPEYFCDRQEETADIINALENGCNMTLISPRRYGKTGLIHNVFHHLREQDKNTICFYVDIYATHSLNDFVQLFAKAVLGHLDTPLQKVESLINKVFRYSQVTMSPDLVTGMPQFSLNFQPQHTASTLEDIFTYLDKSERTCYVAFDEFQQILEYAEKDVEALLRTYIQQTHNVRFIFSGSKQHMMIEMFNSPKHPFYRSTERLHLNTLDEKVYYVFAAEKLKQRGVSLSEDLFHTIYTQVDGVTWYLQAIMNRFYRMSDCIVTKEICQETINGIIKREEEEYKHLYHLLTANQASLLLAIAKEEVVKEPLSGLFLRTHNLKSPSSVQRALQYLMNEEYVYHSDDGYIVYDRFFALWLKKY